MTNELLKATLQLYLEAQHLDDTETILTDINNVLASIDHLDESTISLALHVAKKIGHIENEKKYNSIPTIIIQATSFDNPLEFAEEMKTLVKKYTNKDSLCAIGSNIADENGFPLFFSNDATLPN
jgi:hypothetical protein